MLILTVNLYIHSFKLVNFLFFSVIPVYIIPVNKMIIITRETPLTSHDSPGSLVFWCRRSRSNSGGVNRYQLTQRGRQIHVASENVCDLQINH